MQLANIAVYPADSTDFSHQGYGILSDVLSAVVTEATADNNNVSQELEVTYPIGGTNVEYIKNTNMIRASTGTGADDYMIFEIYDYDENTDGTLSVHAQALPYRILKIPFDNGGIFDKFATVQLAINGGLSHVTGFPNWFHITSDVDVKQDFRKDQISNLGGMLDLILDRTECYVEYGWNYIKILKNRGKQITDVVLRDDSNVSGVQVVADYSNIINKIVPLLRARNAAGEYTDEPDYLGKIVTSKNPFKYIKYWSGMAAKFDGQEVADNYFVKEGVDQPKITATVNPLIIDDNLTAVKLFDSMQVYASKINYTATLKVVSRTFDALTCEVTDFKLGDKKKTLIDNNSTLSNIEDKINQANDTAQYAVTSSNGKNTNYYSEDEPKNPVEGDTWFHTDDKGRPIIDQYIDGKWVQIVGHEKEDEVDKAIDQAQKDTEEAVKHANDAVAKADDANTKADQAVEQAGFAKNQADSAKTDAQNANTAAQTAFKNAETAIKNINDLTIDGRNLLENSMLSRASAPTVFGSWNGQLSIGWGDPPTVVSDLSAPYQQFIRLKANNATVAPNTSRVYFTTRDKVYKESRFPIDKTITLAVYVRSSMPGVTAFASMDGVEGKHFVLGTSVWTLLTVTGKPVYWTGDLNRINFAVNFTGNIPVGGLIDTTGWQVVRNTKVGVWTAAPEDPQASIENLNGQITLKANKADVDSVNNRVSSAESKITVNANNIALKASKTDVDTVANRVSVAEGKITVNANAIAQTVSKTELTNKLSGYATQTWTQGQIKVTSDNINLNVSKVQTNLDNISSSDRNLLLGSGELTSGIDAGAQGGILPGGNWQGNKIAHFKKHLSSYADPYQLTTSIIPNGTQYLLSFYAKADVAGEGFTCYFYNPTNTTHGLSSQGVQSTGSDGAIGITLTTTWTRYWILWTQQTTATAPKHVIIGRTGPALGTAPGGKNTKGTYMSSPMLVEGNIRNKPWTAAPEDYATQVEYASLEVKVNGIQSTVANKADQSQVTQLDNQITSTVTALGNKADKSQITQLSNQITSAVSNTSSPNLVANSGLPKDTRHWVSNNNPQFLVSKHAFYRGGTENLFTLRNPSPTAETTAGTEYFKITRNTIHTISAIMFGGSNVVGVDVWLLARKTGSTTGYKKAILVANNFKPDPSKAVRLHWSINVGDYDEAMLRIDNNGSSSNSSTLYFGEVKVEQSPVPTVWVYDEYKSQITQMADDINLRVKTNDVINQINISKEGILIDGKRTHITGTTTIDNAVIKDAMIADIKADKITAGTLNAANVNVVNLNANNITTGTLKGANLSMNLNTGEILFQKGSIRSTDGKLNMRINDGSMSLTNSSGDGVYFKDGVMALTDSNFWTNQSHIKYGEISFDTSIFTGATSIVGAALRGNSGVIVGTSNFVPNLYLGPTMTSVKGGGIGVSKDRAYMASEGIASVVGGVSYESLWSSLQPAVMVGVGSSYTSGSIWQAATTKAGNGTFIEGHIVGLTSDSKEAIMKPSKTSDLALASDERSGYVLSMSVYGRTYSSGAGMTVTPNGVLGRISSASKYKLAIGEISTLNDEAHQFLSVKPKQWFDKLESEALADTMTTGNTDYIDDVKALPHTGFIAEDLYTAGLDNYVIRGNDGSIESIQYDRLPVLHHELIRELFNRLDAAEMEIYKLKQEVINNAN